MCLSIEEVEELAKEEDVGLIDYSLMIKNAKEKIQNGEAPKPIRKGVEVKKGQGKDFLKNARSKSKGDD
jgi:hypothetical protein